MTTIAQFVNTNNITMASDYADENPAMPGEYDMNHFRLTLRRRDTKGRRTQMSLFFSQGVGLSGEPSIANVLDCLASDASSIENAGSFEEWAEDFGLDTDSRKDERAYRLTKRQATKLKTFLGDEGYSALLWDTERD